MTSNRISTVIVIGIITSAIMSFIFRFIAGVYAGTMGFIRDWLWLFLISAIPIIISFVTVSIFDKYIKRKRFNKWLFGAIIAFFSVAFAGSIGAITVNSIRFGIDRVNIEGYLASGPLYGLVLLPITTPVAVALITIYFKVMQRFTSK